MTRVKMGGWAGGGGECLVKWEEEGGLGGDGGAEGRWEGMGAGALVAAVPPWRRRWRARMPSRRGRRGRGGPLRHAPAAHAPVAGRGREWGGTRPRPLIPAVIRSVFWSSRAREVWGSARPLPPPHPRHHATTAPSPRRLFPLPVPLSHIPFFPPPPIPLSTVGRGVGNLAGTTRARAPAAAACVRPARTGFHPPASSPAPPPFHPSVR